MCGICGIHRFNDTPISRDAFDILLLNNQNRGLEATGVALQQADGTVQVLKDDCTAFEFVGGQSYKAFMAENLLPDTVTIIGHCRKATKGSPKMIKNNHPMFAGQTAVIHNGHISNDDWLFTDMKLDRKAETDSDILRAILDRDGFTPKAITNLSRATGSAAIAAVSPKYPGKLLLGRSGNPIELLGTADCMMFSSEKSPLYKALRPVEVVYGIPMRRMVPGINHYMIGMTDHSAWLFGSNPKDGQPDWSSDWLEWHHELKIAYNFTPAHYTCHAQFHGNRMKFYDDKPLDVVECPKCKNYMSVASALHKDLPNYKCRACGSPLG